MRKVVIKEIDGYDYILADGHGNIYILNIEFYSKYKPVCNDIIYISEKILNEKNFFAFGEIYNTNNVDLENLIKVVHDKNEYYFQRKFG